MSLLLARAVLGQQAPASAGGITFVGSDQAGDDSDNTSTLSMSGFSVLTNDFGLLFYYSDGAGSSGVYAEVDTPSGWNLHPSFPQANTGGRDRKIWLFWQRFSSGGTAAPSLAVNNAQSRARGANMQVFRGVSTSTAFDVTPEYAFGSNDDTPSSPAVNPVTDGVALASFVGFNAGAARTVDWTDAEPAGFEIASASSSDRVWTAGAYDIVDNVSGDTGIHTWAPGGMDPADESGMVTVALRPA